MRKLWIAVLALAVFGPLAAIAVGAQGTSPEANVLRESIPVGTDSAGRTWNLGGFSALATIGSSAKEFWSVTDRGPNDDSDRDVGGALYCSTKPSGKVIFLPGFNPQLVKLHADNGKLTVQERIPLHDGAHPASGKPNLTFDENTFTQTNAATKTCQPLASGGGVIDPFGVDTEGVAVDPRDGSFWLADEYRPSIIHVASDGQILARLVPQDLPAAPDPDGMGPKSPTPSLPMATNYANAVAAAGATFDVQPVFPGIVNAFRKNRGFEGLALSPDGQTLYTLLQSPMDYQGAFGSAIVPNADRNAARNSPYIRVFKLDVSDTAAPSLSAEWIYLQSRGFNAPSDDLGRPDKISDVQSLGDDVLLIQERDDLRPTVTTKEYRVDFSDATDIADPANTEAFALAAKPTFPTLEQTNPKPSFIASGASTLALDLASMLNGAGIVNSKIEGTATQAARGANPALFAAVNDNDFDLDHTVGLAPTANPTQLDLFPQP